MTSSETTMIERAIDNMLRLTRNFSKTFCWMLLSALGLSLALSGSTPLFPVQVHASASPKLKLSCPVIGQVISSYLNHHYQSRKLTPATRKATAENYYKTFDFNRTLFIADEAAKIKKDLTNIFTPVLLGDCKKLTEIQKRVIERTQEIEKFVRGFVGNPKYKLNENISLVTDPNKRDHPSGKKNRESILKKYLHFQISNYLESGTKLKEAKKKLIHRYELYTKRAKEKEQKDLFANFLNAFAAAMDPHSSYFSPDDLEDFQISLGLSLEGIGVSLSSRDGYTTVEEIIPGGAADQLTSKKLKPKDRIIAVRQKEGSAVDIIDMDLRDVVRLIRGKSGTEVTLTVLRQGATNKRFKTTIVRDKIDLKEQAAKLVFKDITDPKTKKKSKLAVIDLPSFYGNENKSKTAYKDVRRLLKEVRSKKADGLLLDLSRNGGGLLDDAVKIAGLFVQTGGMVATQTTQGRTEILRDTDDDVQFNGPLVVLTSRISASASEIVAGAIKDYRRGIIVGDDHTFGKGTVQSVLPLPPGLGAMKITTGMFFRPGGKSTQHDGVRSDIVVPTRFSKEDIGESSLDNSLKSRKISPFISKTANSSTQKKKWSPVTDALISRLKQNSNRRTKSSKDFKEIRKDLNEAKKSKGVINLAELRKKAQEGKKEKEEEEKKNKDTAKNEEPSVQQKEALSILAEYVKFQTAMR